MSALSPVVRAYAHALGFAVVWIDRDGKARAGSFPSVGKPTTLAWTKLNGARRIARWINTHDRPIGLSTAANACRVTIVSHAVFVRRAKSAARTIDRALDVARRTGALKTIHQAYKTGRERALASGEHAPSFGHAMARVRRALYARVAAGKALPALDELVSTVAQGPSDGVP